MYRSILIALLTAMALVTSSSMADNPKSSEINEYRLIVTSSNDKDILIQGSILFSSSDSGFIQIDDTTPYEKTVNASAILSIVHAPDKERKVVVTLEKNGSPMMFTDEKGDWLVAFGERIPASSLRWSAAY